MTNGEVCKSLFKNSKTTRLELNIILFDKHVRPGAWSCSILNSDQNSQ